MKKALLFVLTLGLIGLGTFALAGSASAYDDGPVPSDLAQAITALLNSGYATIGQLLSLIFGYAG